MDINMDSPIWQDLPDDIIVNIMEKVRNLRLDFEDCGTNHDYLRPRFKFLEFVRRSLTSHQGISVGSVRLAFDTQDVFDDDVGEYVVENCLLHCARFARTKCVQSLELNLDHCAALTLNPRIKHFRFPMDSFSRGMPTLTSLSLNSIHITTHQVTDLLRSCLINLETLVIKNAPQLRVLSITAPRLKHLEIHCGLDVTIFIIDIHSAPNLKRIKCLFADAMVLRFYHVLPNLSNVALCGPFCQDNVMTPLQYYAPNLEKLELVFDVMSEFMCNSKSHPICSSNNINLQLTSVKHLVLHFPPEADCIMDFMLVVASCPNLQNVTIKCVESRKHIGKACGGNHWDKTTSYKHQCLKVVEFVGWMGRKHDVELANCLMRSCVNLEKVTYFWSPTCWQKKKMEQDLKDAMTRFNENEE